MTPTLDTPDDPGTRAWAERWPVLAPSLGALMGLAWTTVAVSESDWAATTVFGSLTATLGAVGVRNYRVRHDVPAATGDGSGRDQRTAP